MDDVSDRELLDACVAGDRRAWTTFVHRFTRYVYYLIRLTARRHGAALDDEELADLHNDLFMALLEDDRRRLRAYTGRNGCSVRSWIRVITIRRTLDHLRRRRVHLSLDGGDKDEAPHGPVPVDAGPDPLEYLLARAQDDRRDRLTALAARLNPSDRLLLELVYIRGLPTEHVAATLNTSRGAIYTRKTRLLHRLRSLAAEAGLLEDP